MNSKIYVGMMAIVLGVLFLLKNILPELISVISALFNYKIILLLVGFIAIFKNKVIGWILVLFASYLLMRDYIPDISDIAFAVVAVAAGLILVYLGKVEDHQVKEEQQRKEQNHQ